MIVLRLRPFVSVVSGAVIAALSLCISLESARAAEEPPKSELDPALIKKFKGKRETPAQKDTAEKKDVPPAGQATTETAPAQTAPAQTAPSSKVDPELIKRFKAAQAKSKETAPSDAPPATDAPAKKEESDQSVTYAKHIAAILWKNCAECHRPGEIGPFSLLTFEDASEHAAAVAEASSSRHMPPWKPEPNFGKFHDERRLSDQDIDLISKWAKAGAPQGNASDLPKPPEFAEGWPLGKPDMELKMAEPFTVPAEGGDVDRAFVIPIPIEKDTTLSAVEFRPGNRAVVYHAAMFLDFTGAARKRDAEDDEPGFASSGGPGIRSTGGLGGWSAGVTSRRLPDGVVKYVKKGSDLILQIHYRTNGKAAEDQSTVGLYFSKTPTKQIVTGIAVTQPDVEIPAGEARVEIKAESPPLPVDVTVLGVSPLMLQLGREMKVTASKPGSDAEVPLVWIKNWDFNWKRPYQFEKPLQLPKGSVIKVQAVYGKPAVNPTNPDTPPPIVQSGEPATDEMCQCALQVITDKPGDLKLVAAMRGNELGPGLEGGFPGLALRKPPPAKKATAKTEVPLEIHRYEKAGKKSDPFADGGVTIPEDQKKLLSRFDLDGDGKLSRKEVGKMPSPMQAFVVRKLIKKSK